ncbi:uncharacterized protein LOC131675661 [Phymastichus coffea]|uniref:uncharacterized protein LOC131675661 n=1 Tax=Phymastichus coffea TaxID=108790 RepID=UPI00273CF09E|nr:uncharacterized protein LOC131675661 [Phymastichus coffea]
MYLPLFPKPFDGQISSEEFLSTSKELVKILDYFGKIFMTMKYDMQANIGILTEKFNENQHRYYTLQKLISVDKNSSNTTVSDALLWLGRSLHMVQTYFEYIVSDYESNKFIEDQTANFTMAYKNTLEPYQGYTAQQLFSLLMRTPPSRSQIIKGLANGYDIDQAIIMRSIAKFSRRLKENICILKTLYNEHSL